ncbi:MAG TPA: YbgC/FadM family acyl-CoA thioesterase, partial [Geminicoccaceae bacterium]|nr:YbgC/FadM family acyl-CoA thioesterase [Geminicoccaceae bacterium]
MRVYYEDTDAAGIVYHANYLKFAERARTELLRLLDLDHVGLGREDGGAFAVRRCTIDYLAPARLDDLLEVRTRLLRLGGATLDLSQRVCRGDDGAALAALELTLVRLDGRLRPLRLPRRLRAALQEFVPA